MDTESFGNNEDRISRQRIERRDLLLPEQPTLSHIYRWHLNLVKAHVIYCITVLITGYIFPQVAIFLAKIVMPISNIVSFVYPNYFLNQHFTGVFNPEFYRSISGEAFFLATITAIIYSVVYVGRYWRFPWRFCDYVQEQLGVRKSATSALITTITSGFFSFLFGFPLYVWLGLFDSETMSGAIKVHQLMLWSILMPGASLCSVFVILLTVSGVLSIGRRLFLRV
jgi:hypothetical protein